MQKWRLCCGRCRRRSVSVVVGADPTMTIPVCEYMYFLPRTTSCIVGGEVFLLMIASHKHMWNASKLWWADDHERLWKRRGMMTIQQMEHRRLCCGRCRTRGLGCQRCRRRGFDTSLDSYLGYTRGGPGIVFEDWDSSKYYPTRRRRSGTSLPFWNGTTVLERDYRSGTRRPFWNETIVLQLDYCSSDWHYRTG